MPFTITGFAGVVAAVVTQLCFQAITRLSVNSAGAASETTAR